MVGENLGRHRPVLRLEQCRHRASRQCGKRSVCRGEDREWAGPDKVPARPAAFTAATRVVKSGLSAAIWTIVLEAVVVAVGVVVVVVVVVEAVFELHAAMSRPAVARDRANDAFRNFMDTPSVDGCLTAEMDA